MLKDNPFYVLNVPMSATRREIASKVEEQSFFFDSEICNEAQACLTNPAKRISAEVTWFPGESEDTIREIRKAINDDKDIETGRLGIVGQLNACLDNFVRSEQDNSHLAERINTIDVLFDIIDSNSLCEKINADREKAGIAETDPNRVNEELQRLRETIRTAITEKFTKYDDDVYVRIVSEIAESCMSSDDMSHGVIVDDVINQYELRMQPVIEEKTEELEKLMDGIIQQVSIASVRNSRIDTFINKLKEWDVYVQPLQLRTQTEGYAHAASQRVASEARALAITLHNEAHAIPETTRIMEALREVFAELPEYAALLDGDLNTLEENKNAANQYYRGGGSYGNSTQSYAGNASQGTSTAGTIGSVILNIVLRFWWIILLLAISLFSCEDDNISSTNTSSNSNDSAYEDSVDYHDPYEDLEEQPMPENEHKFVNEFGDDRPSQIIVENPTDYAYVMKFEDASGTTVFSFFVRPQSTTPMYMGLGTYYLKWAGGTTWYGEKDLFGPDTVYRKDPESWPFEAGKYWTLTMQAITNGNVHTDSISADEF